MQKKLIVGLGNPGEEYRMTYHNAGLLALKAIAEALDARGEDVGPWKTHAGLFRYAAAGNIIFVEPSTFMNEAGAAVREAMKKFRAAPSDLVVLHDESDMALGTYKLSTERNSAGHKGAQSVIDALGTNGFTRVRIGIRNPREKKRRKAEELVLRGISPGDERELRAVFARIAEELLSRNPTE